MSALPIATAKDGGGLAPVRIGMSRGLFRGLPESVATASSRPFSALVEAQTGLPGEVAIVQDADVLTEKMRRHQIHLGVFSGIDFAWARQTHAELRPLMLAVSEESFLQAHLMVRQDRAEGAFDSLADSHLAWPQGSKDHCRLFVEHGCVKAGKEMSTFFSKLSRPATAEDALDDVVDGIAEVAVVDAVSLSCYERRKPGRYAKLKKTLSSQKFPATVIAYWEGGAVDEDSLRRFRDGMMNARKSPQAKQLLTLWKITAFEAVPEGYDKVLNDIVKAYPRPQTVAQR